MNTGVHVSFRIRVFILSRYMRKSEIAGSYGNSLWAPLIAQQVKNAPAEQETPESGIPWRREQLPTPVFMGFPGGSASKESTCNAGDPDSIPGLQRSPGEGKGYPLQYSGLENSMDCIVHGVAKSPTQLSDFHFHAILFSFQRNFLTVLHSDFINLHFHQKCRRGPFFPHPLQRLLFVDILMTAILTGVK